MYFLFTIIKRKIVVCKYKYKVILLTEEGEEKTPGMPQNSLV